MNNKNIAEGEAYQTEGSKLGRIFLFSLAGLAALIALFYAEEDMRGSHAWNSYREGLKAKGEKLDFKEFIPKSVPDEENFGGIPFVKSWFVNQQAPIWSKTYLEGQEKFKPAETKKNIRNLIDLAAWEAAFGNNRAHDPSWLKQLDQNNPGLDSRGKSGVVVLGALQPDAATITELRTASTRTYAQYPVKYDLENPAMVLLPHLAKIKSVEQHLSLRACAELAAGQGGNALDDVKVALFMCDSLKEEPFLISYLVRVASIQIALQPVWEGLAQHRWTDAQLLELQSHLEKYDFPGDLKFPLDGERAMHLKLIETIRNKGPGEFVRTTDDNPKPSAIRNATLVGLLIPSGWYDLEAVNYCKLDQSEMDLARLAKPTRMGARNKELDRLRSENIVSRIIHHHVLAAILVPELEGLSRKPALAQTAVNEAALACALERYRLAKGAFPASLDALTPDFIAQLPNDVITGEPYKYRLADDGKFVLYSVGWNKKDERGVPGKILFDVDHGDWVW